MANIQTILKAALANFILVGQLTVAAQEAPVRVEMATDQAPMGCYSNCPERGMQWGETEDYVTRNLLVVQSTVDNLTVTDIIVNRGSCGDLFTLPPQTLKFGESLTSPIGDDCKPIEVVVETSMGEWKFGF